MALFGNQKRRENAFRQAERLAKQTLVSNRAKSIANEQPYQPDVETRNESRGQRSQQLAEKYSEPGYKDIAQSKRSAVDRYASKLGSGEVGYDSGITRKMSRRMPEAFNKNVYQSQEGDNMFKGESERQRIEEMKKSEATLEAAPINKNYKVDEDKKNKVIATVIGEALGEGEEGMQAVMNVVNNRVLSGNVRDFGENVFGVISHPGQFSAFSVDNVLYTKIRDYLRGEDVNLSEDEKEAVEYVKKLYEKVSKGRLKDLTNDALFYMRPEHSEKGNKEWMESKEQITKIGNHVFYK